MSPINSLRGTSNARNSPVTAAKSKADVDRDGRHRVCVASTALKEAPHLQHSWGHSPQLTLATHRLLGQKQSPEGDGWVTRLDLRSTHIPQLIVVALYNELKSMNRALYFHLIFHQNKSEYQH